MGAGAGTVGAAGLPACSKLPNGSELHTQAHDSRSQSQMCLSNSIMATASGVLLKMEVGIRKGRGEGPEGTLLIYDH